MEHAARRAVGGVVLVVVLQLLVFSVTVNAAVYKVGDSSGWTTIGNVDYKKWAATKTFHISDVILFEYNPEFHNVMQVNHSAYKACDASAPIATHTTGNDSITITRHGHYLFLCGVPGHCQAGQKVDIRVVGKTASSNAPSPNVNPVATAISPGPSSAAAALAPSAPLKGLLCVIAAAMLAFLN